MEIDNLFSVGVILTKTHVAFWKWDGFPWLSGEMSNEGCSLLAQAVEGFPTWNPIKANCTDKVLVFKFAQLMVQTSRTRGYSKVS